MILTAVSASALVSTSGGHRRSVLRSGAEHQQTALEALRRRADRARWSRAPSSRRSRTSSMPIISPMPRTSPIKRCFVLQGAQSVHQVRAHDAAFSISDPLIRSMVASAAAHATGLPPNVLACDPGGHVMMSARAVVTPSGKSGRDALGDGDDVGLDGEMLDRKHLSRAAHPRLHLVEDEVHPVLAASSARRR